MLYPSFYIKITTLLVKNPSFSGKYYKNKKALQQMPKGWKWSGSP